MFAAQSERHRKEVSTLPFEWNLFFSSSWNYLVNLLKCFAARWETPVCIIVGKFVFMLCVYFQKSVNFLIKIHILKIPPQ